MSILDTIDNAINDHELSTDAMRWTPERATAAGPDIASFAESLDFPLTEWQQRILDHRDRIEVDLGRVHVHMRIVADQFAQAMKGIAAAFQPLIDETHRALELRRPARVTQLRRAYRAKRRGRW